MTPRTIKKPKLPQEFASAAVDGGVLEAERVYESLRLTDCDLSGQEADSVEILRSLLQRVNLSGAVLRRLQAGDARFQECDLSNADWSEGGVQRVEIVGSRMIGFRADEAYCRDIRLEECNAAFSRFHRTQFKDAHFEGCDFRDADFHGADLTGAVFHNCDLTRARFTHAVCVETDFRASTIDELVIGAKEWRGAILDPFQTVVLAGLLGVQVK